MPLLHSILLNSCLLLLLSWENVSRSMAATVWVAVGMDVLSPSSTGDQGITIIIIIATATTTTIHHMACNG
ncbi:hypothetical protein K431DRAFT_289412 [Polychaeton citri CBS 116435]|uniref:Secreted protein n=1 Tax=Polychaeton citri CBS 116435 TaxID=1314669 RepID=A0A9P4UK72_9PEZI|nr:hypothetical protein K431DRAFT_289412 [Polychaeton citri CBS 116435]